jgi:predicted ester cyclase
MEMPPTGKPIAITCKVLARIKDGKVVERAGNQDELTMLKQLGVMP